VPQRNDLEDTILDWLDVAETEEAPAAQPRIINMPKEERPDDDGARRRQGPIRRKSTDSEPAKADSQTRKTS
jgi:hypothetical protein